MPTIGITLGDPAGIGPEVVAKTLAELEVSPGDLIVFGDTAILERGAEACQVSIPESVRIVDTDTVPESGVTPGQPNAGCGVAQVAYLQAAVRAARAAEIDALVTAPISKHAARAADFSFLGHTEYLADRLGAARIAMMFAGPTLRVVLATTHMPLAQVPGALTRDRIIDVALLGIDALNRDFGIEKPRVGVLALNPHAGERGLLGREEEDVISPAIEHLRRLQRDCEIAGPLVADAAFRGKWDLLVAMYHDQALIPVKLLDFERSVNVTLGLPIVRTSPDHGVAYDIAGTGSASNRSFAAALELARAILERRRSADH